MRLIDADALIATMENMRSVSNNVKQRRIEDSILHGIVPQIIDDAPTIEAEPVKHGRWEEKHYMEMKWIPSRFDDVSPEDVDIEPMVELKCSKCHLWSVNFRNHIELKYCPNCGARMEGNE